MDIDKWRAYIIWLHVSAAGFTRITARMSLNLPAVLNQRPANSMKDSEPGPWKYQWLGVFKIVVPHKLLVVFVPHLHMRFSLPV